MNPQKVQETESDEEDSPMSQISRGLKTFVIFAEKRKHYDVALAHYPEQFLSEKSSIQKASEYPDDVQESSRKNSS